MLWYIRCPSCGEIISYELDKFFKKLKEITNDPSLNTKEKENAQEKLITNLGYEKYCCKARILGLLPYHEIIQT